MPGNRRSIRLRDYNYAETGAYYVTVCVNEPKCIFGEICNGEMVLNEAGHMVNKWWPELPNRFSNIEMDEFIVMPNHMHGIINIGYGVGAPLVGALNHDRAAIVGAPLVGALNHDRAAIKAAPTLGEIIGAFKSITTNEYIRNVKINNWPSFNKRLWQRNFYEHVIRAESDRASIREYIINNPADWQMDEYFS